MGELKLTKYNSPAGSMVTVYKKHIPDMEEKQPEEVQEFLTDFLKKRDFEFWEDKPYIQELIYKFKVQIKYDHN